MAARRRLLMQQQAGAIGYLAGFWLGWDADAQSFIPTQYANYFVTGFIPYSATNGAIKLTGKYSSNGYTGANTHFVAFYDENKVSVSSSAYYDMTRTNERSVTNTAAWLVSPTRFIRFVGRLDSIDDCFIRDDATGIILWKKGM